MLAIAMLFSDFFFQTMLQRWLILTLPIYFFTRLITSKEKGLTRGEFCFFLALLIIEDYGIHGTFGLCLVYLLPMLVIIENLKLFFHDAPLVFLNVTIACYVLIEALLAGRWILGKELSLYVTVIKIFANIVVGILVFLGIRGDRFFFVSTKKKRKVWTPNRIDAS